MGRPVIGHYIKGPRCPKCGDNRLHLNGMCVTCTKKANAEKYQQRKRLDRPGGRKLGAVSNFRSHQNMSIERISTMVAHDASSVSGVSRGRYLDDLLRTKFNLADHDNDMPKCGGDLHRASLPVGDPYAHHSGQHGPSRDSALDSLRDAINAIWDRLPDLVIMRDIRDCLPPDVLDDLGSRERVNIRIAFAFSDRGVVVRRIGQADKRSARRLYILRNHDQ